MRVKVQKELRSVPKAAGLKFVYFVLFLGVFAGCALWIINDTTILRIFISLLIIAGAYTAGYQLSRTEHARKINISPDIRFWCDTINFIPRKSK